MYIGETPKLKKKKMEKEKGENVERTLYSMMQILVCINAIM